MNPKPGAPPIYNRSRTARWLLIRPTDAAVWLGDIEGVIDLLKPLPAGTYQLEG